MPRTDAEAGFTLIEVVCVLAIIGLLAALVLPAIPRATSQERLVGYAVEVAALLKADRNAAIRSHAQVATSLDAERRIVISGATASMVEIPADVTFEALLAQRCGDRRVGATIDFFPSGASCGGVIALARQGVGYQFASTGSPEASKLCQAANPEGRGIAGFTLIEALAALAVMGAGLAAIGASRAPACMPAFMPNGILRRSKLLARSLPACRLARRFPWGVSQALSTHTTGGSIQRSSARPPQLAMRSGLRNASRCRCGRRPAHC